MTEKLNYEERKQWACTLYTKHDFSNKDIALTVDVDEATVRNWIREGGWTGIKRSLLTSKKNQLEMYYAALEKVDSKVKSDEEFNPKNIELVVKYTNAIKNLEIEASVSQIIEVFDLFTRWLMRRDLKLAKKVVPYIDAFIKEKEAA